MKRMFSPARVFSIAAVLLFASAVSAQEKAADADPVIVTAGSIRITKSDFEKVLAALPAEYRQYVEGPGRRTFAEDYVRMRLLAAEGEKAGLATAPAVVEQLELMRQNLIATEQLRRIEADVAVKDEDLKKTYEENLAQHVVAKARHILVAFEGSPAAQDSKPKLTEEAAKAKAEKIRGDIEGGASFEELAGKESDDVGSGASGGSLGEFGPGQMVPEFEKAIFGGKAGELLPVVRTQFGYHVIRVDELSTTPFETVKPTLEQKARQEAVQKVLDAMRAGTTVDFDEAYFGPAAP